MNAFGSIELADGTTPQTLLAYPRVLTCFSDDGAPTTYSEGDLSVDPDDDVDTIYLGRGDYLMSFDLAGEVSGDAATLTMHCRKNGQETGIGCDFEALGTGDAHMSMNGILHVTAADVGADGICPVQIYAEMDAELSSSSSSSSSNSSSSNSSSSSSNSSSSSSSSSNSSSSSSADDSSASSSQSSSSSEHSTTSITPRHANLFLMRLDGSESLGHAGITVESNSSAQVLSTTPAVLSCFNANGMSTSQTQGNLSLTPDVSSDRLRVGAPGVYLVRFTATGESTGATATITVRLRRGGGTAGTGSPGTRVKVASAGSELSMSFTTVVRVTHADMSGGYCNLDLVAMSSTGTPSLTVRFAQLTALRLR